MTWTQPPPVRADIPTIYGGATYAEIRGADPERLRTNQPCCHCGASEGTFSERGFNRCNACGEPGQ